MLTERRKKRNSIEYKTLLRYAGRVKKRKTYITGFQFNIILIFNTILQYFDIFVLRNPLEMEYNQQTAKYLVFG